MITVRRRALHRTAIVVMAVALTPTLAGCWQGFGASTMMQNSMNSGNGTQVTVGSLRVENATVVRGDAGQASLIMSVFNNGSAAEELVAVSVNDQPVQLTNLETATIEPGGNVTFGYGSEGAPATNYLVTSIDIEPGSYTSVELSFSTAGTTRFESIVVPPVGYYEGLLPDTILATG